MKLQEDVPLAPLTTLGVGGHARFYCEARTESELEEALAWARQRRVPLSLLGGGSNVVVADAGFDGLVIRVALRGIKTSALDDRVRVCAMAGESWDDFVSGQVALDRQGLECLTGIPGLVGATPIQNVGAYGQEVAQTIVQVHALHVATGEARTFSSAECEFAYRDSAFKRNLPGEFVVTQVEFELVPGGRPLIRYGELSKALEAEGQDEPISLTRVAATVRALRANKSMVLVPGAENSRSCGSFFVNPVVPLETLSRIQASVDSGDVPHYPEPDGRVKLPAAWLIEQSGLKKGHREGRVGLSTRHTLALVCYEDATASDVVAFAARVRATVEKRFAVRLVPEPNFWGFSSLDDRLPEPASAERAEPS